MGAGRDGLKEEHLDDVSILGTRHQNGSRRRLFAIGLI